MPLNESSSRLAILIWAVTWLPGLFLFAYRVVPLVAADRALRAVVQGAAIASLPVAAFGLYVLSDAALQRQASDEVSLVALAWSIAQVATPYVVCTLHAWWKYRRSSQPLSAGRWWVGAAIGVGSVPFLTPGLFVAQLMVFFGG